MDKLTHAGNYGIDCSMETLAALFDEKIDYYVKVNFQSVIDIVDALGGITVHADVPFGGQGYTNGAYYYFYEGDNYLSGDEALTFCRVRKAFADGDRQRGRNQQAVIIGILKKAMSPAILNSYNEILEAVTENIQTNITVENIMQLINMQLNDNADWTIETVSVDGYGAMSSTYTYGSEPLYVMNPDTNSVSVAIDLINEVMQAR